MGRKLNFNESKIYQTLMAKGTYLPTLGEFLEDLFCRKLIVDGRDSYPIIKNDFADVSGDNKIELALNCIPDKWINKEDYNKSNTSLTTYLSAFVNGRTNNYILGSCIIRRFFLDVSNTKKSLEGRLKKILSSPETTVDFEMLGKYMEHLIWFSKRDLKKTSGGLFELSINRDNFDESTNMKVFAGTDKYNDFAIDKMKTLLDNKRWSELLARFMLCFIIISKTYPELNSSKSKDDNKKVEKNEQRRKTSNLCSMLIWYDSVELANLGIWDFSMFENCKGQDRDVLYPYAIIFYENGRTNLSYFITEKLMDNPPSKFPAEMIYFLYAKHLLFGRGCVKNVEEAFSVFKKIYKEPSNETETVVEGESLFDTDKKLERFSFNRLENENMAKILENADKEILKFIREIIDGKYAEIYISDKDKKRFITEDVKAKEEEENILDFLHEYSQGVVAKAFNFTNATAFDNPCRVINGNSKEALVFEASMNDTHKTVVFSNEQDLCSAVLTAMDKKQVDFVLFSDDKNKNLEDCLDLINRLSYLEDANSISEYIDIYVKADFEYASMMVDSALNMSNCCFRVHICDYNKLTAQKLLADAPLFIPTLQGEAENNVIVFGTNEATLALAKEIVAVANVKSVHSVAFIGEDADGLKQRLNQDAPGIFMESDSLNRVVPRFYNCNTKITDFVGLLSYSCNEPEMSQLCDELNKGTYFIVDLGTDEENIRFATKLRGWLLSCDKYFMRTPFIAVKCESLRTANIAKNLVVNNKKPGKTFYNNYNLYFYGSRESVFSSDYLDVHKNPLRKLGLNIHLAYWGDNITEEQRLQAIDSYYKFSYNRDSSECAAVSLAYMLNYFKCINAFEEIRYNPQKMSEEYNDWLKKDSNNTDRAARFEHARWTGFVLSRGWRSATYEQIVAYSGQSSGSDHKHLLCKLHPFLLNWDQFSEDSEGDIKMKALKGAIDDLRSPVEITRYIVSSIGDILVRNPFDKIPKAKEK